MERVFGRRGHREGSEKSCTQEKCDEIQGIVQGERSVVGRHGVGEGGREQVQFWVVVGAEVVLKRGL